MGNFGVVVLTFLLGTFLSTIISCAQNDAIIGAPATAAVIPSLPAPAPSVLPSPSVLPLPSPLPSPSPSPSPTPSPSPSVNIYEWAVDKLSLRNRTEILFVIDNSGSMIEELDGTAQYVTRLTDQLVAAQTEFTIRMATTDDQTPGQLIATKVGKKQILSSEGNANRELQEMLHAIPFPAYNGEEIGLRSAMRAIQQFMPQAPLNIIIISDEEDDSPERFADLLSGFQNYQTQRQVKLAFHPIVFHSKSVCALEPDESWGTRYSDMALAFSENGSKVHDLCRLDLAMRDLAVDTMKSDYCRILPVAAGVDLKRVELNAKALSSQDYTWKKSAREFCLPQRISLKENDHLKVSY